MEIPADATARAPAARRNSILTRSPSYQVASCMYSTNATDVRAAAWPQSDPGSSAAPAPNDQVWGLETHGSWRAVDSQKRKFLRAPATTKMKNRLESILCDQTCPLALVPNRWPLMVGSMVIPSYHQPTVQLPSWLNSDIQSAWESFKGVVECREGHVLARDPAVTNTSSSQAGLGARLGSSTLSSMSNTNYSILLTRRTKPNMSFPPS